MAFTFSAKNSTRFSLTGTIGDDVINLSDNLIQPGEVANDDPPLEDPIDLLAGGLGLFRQIKI